MGDILKLFPFFLQQNLESLQTGERYPFDTEFISKNPICQRET